MPCPRHEHISVLCFKLPDSSLRSDHGHPDPPFLPFRSCRLLSLVGLAYDTRSSCAAMARASIEQVDGGEEAEEEGEEEEEEEENAAPAAVEEDGDEVR